MPWLRQTKVPIRFFFFPLPILFKKNCTSKNRIEIIFSSYNSIYEFTSCKTKKEIRSEICLAKENSKRNYISRKCLTNFFFFFFHVLLSPVSEKEKKKKNKKNKASSGFAEMHFPPLTRFLS